MRFALAVLLLALTACESGGSSSKRADAIATDAASTGAHLLECSAGECTDPVTGLVWRLSLEDIGTDAAGFCAALETPAGTDWRIPTCDEVRAVDDDPAVDNGSKPINKSLDTPMALCTHGGAASSVDTDGNVYPQNGGNGPMLCVRGP